MYARVARWEGADGDAMRRAAAEIESRASEGPPEGVPAKGFVLLVDPDNGRGLGVSFFETEDDMRRGDAKLDTMEPPGNAMGKRISVETYEVAVDVRS